MIELVEEFGIDWNDRTVLVIAPGAAGLADSLRSDGGVADVDALESSEGIGGELEERIYDVVVVGDVLYECSPDTVHGTFRWIRDHLRPGGECLVQTRTWLGPDGGGLGNHVRTPYAHLAFARDAVEEYFEANDWDLPTARNRMCRATYLVLFRRAGLEIEDVHVDEHEPRAFLDTLQVYDPSERGAAGFRARLRRPRDDESELDELRRLLIAQ